MPGAGSALDKNDWRMLHQLSMQVERVADELERMNDNLEAIQEAGADKAEEEENDSI